MDAAPDAGVEANFGDDRQHQEGRSQRKPQPISEQSIAKLENYIGDGPNSYRIKSRPLEKYVSTNNE